MSKIWNQKIGVFKIQNMKRRSRERDREREREREKERKKG
jgi:hypothetical protein